MANGKATIRLYFSDLIGEVYKGWHDTKLILDGGTGAGKTYFCLNKVGVNAQVQEKSVLYLCNRTELKEDINVEVKFLGLRDTVEVMTYQKLERNINHNVAMPHYDYIIADECHYCTNDAKFNEYTDTSYRYLQEQTGNVVIFISATAKVFFNYMQKKIVTPDHYFCIPKNYDYVDKIVFYDKKLLPAKGDEILEQEEDTKIVIFCNSYNRVMELFKLYGDKACYFCSKNAKALSAIRNDGCIYKHEDGSETFDKRILVTTKVLDNGINIKDKKVKHIFCEILDVDSAIQALGRKRQISDDDTCTFYIKDYTPQAIQGILNTDIAQVEPVKLYKNDYDLFMKKFGQNRKRMRENKIFYPKFMPDKNQNQLVYNPMRYKKYIMDITIYRDMKELSYQEVMIKMLGEDIRPKVETLDMYVEQKDEFMEYLHTLEGRNLYAEDRKELVKWFETIGVKLRWTGINTLNGALQDRYGNKYKFRFRDCVLDENGKLTKKKLTDNRRVLPDGTPNPNRNKKYWVLEETSYKN